MSADACNDAVRSLSLEVTGQEVRELEPIEAGLGMRRFFRVHFAGTEPRSLIARVEQPEDAAGRPAGSQPEPPLEPIRRLLEQAGLPVPKRWGADEARGIELLEDLGSISLQRWVGQCPVAERRALYREACALVPRLQALRANTADVAAFGRRLGPELFVYKAEQLIRWGLPWMHQRETTPGEAETVRRAFDEISRFCDRAPQRLAHRDFKAANLHVQQHSGKPRLVMIDLQGAFLAPPEYDLVCLLRDFQSPLPGEEIALHLDETRAMLPDAPAAGDYALRFALLTLTRVGKDLSRFVYAMRERGDMRNESLLPNAVSSLRDASRDAADFSPALAGLAELLHAGPRASA